MREWSLEPGSANAVEPSCDGWRFPRRKEGVIRLPPGPVCWTTVRTTVLVWVVLRAIAGMSSGSPGMLLPASLFLMAGAATTAVVDITVARERIFLGNLGVGRRAIGGLAFFVAGALEITAALVIRAMGIGS